jgi:hypothetical protein
MAMTPSPSLTGRDDEDRSGKPSLDPTLKALWLKALRSGEYLQGAVYLERNDRFCCLGVLCKIAGMPRNAEEAGEVGYEFIHEKLPVSQIHRLWSLNDCGSPFPEIADWIETNVQASGGER